MARGKADENAAILEYALHHLERERDEIQTRIDHIQRQLGARVSSDSASAKSFSATPAEPRKRVLSEAARRRIAAAQRRRWAQHRKEKAKTA